MNDTLQKFMTEDGAVRGELVDLSDTWRQVQAHHAYPQPVQILLGEMLAATALLSANLKFNGAIVMQIHGDGPVRLLVVECDAALQMRATAKLAPDAVIEPGASIAQLLNQHGRGRFAITLDPLDKLPGQKAYQGIVPLDGATMAEIIENYMLRSEQLDTRLWLAADGNAARGLLLQRMPGSGASGDPHTIQVQPEDAAETWQRLVALAATLKQPELLDTDVATLRHRLFWEETMRLFEPLQPQFYCTCSREKVGNMLKMLGPAEVASALEELGQLSIDCDFCGRHYEFDKVDCAQLFASEAPAETLLPPSDATH
jgi:molecular chaperone Hsp33